MLIPETSSNFRAHWELLAQSAAQLCGEVAGPALCGLTLENLQLGVRWVAGFQGHPKGSRVLTRPNSGRAANRAF